MTSKKDWADLGGAYLDRVTRDRELTSDDQDLLRSLLGSKVAPMPQWEVYSEPYPVVEPVLDDGTGPIYDTVDWVCVESPNWREAFKLGCKRLEKEFPHGWISNRRGDGLYPYGGIHCRRLLSDWDAE